MTKNNFKKEASNSTYLKTMALLHLAQYNYKQLQLIEKSLQELLGEEPGGHISDAIWGELYTADKLFELLKININKDRLYNNNRD